MKKILLGGFSLFMCVTMAACGNSGETAAITNLSNQLDRTTNTLNSVAEIDANNLDISKESLDKIATENQGTAVNFQYNMVTAQNSIINEEYYKTDILNKTAKIKNYLSGDVKLAKEQINIIKELSNSLSKYNNSVAYSNSEFQTTIKSINNMKKNVDKNSYKINAKLNKLACNSNARCAYYENLLNTLMQLENILGIENIPDNENNEIENDINYEIASDTDKNKENTTDSDNNETDNCPNGECQSSKTSPIGKRNILNRNIDTYGPTLRNIDTYRYYGNGYNNGYANGIYNGYAYGGYGYNGGVNNSYNGINGYGINNGYYGANNGYAVNRRITSNDYNRLAPNGVNTLPVNAPEKRLEEYHQEDATEINDNEEKVVAFHNKHRAKNQENEIQNDQNNDKPNIPEDNVENVTNDSIVNEKNVENKNNVVKTNIHFEPKKIDNNISEKKLEENTNTDIHLDESITKTEENIEEVKQEELVKNTKEEIETKLTLLDINKNIKKLING